MKRLGILAACLMVLSFLQLSCGVKQDPIPYVIAYPDVPPAPAPAPVEAAKGKPGAK